jgi:2-dehydro-3-deoxyglucarate aldolase
LERGPHRKTVDRGDVALDAVAKNPSPMLVEVYGDIELGFAFVDLEHGGPSPYDSEYLEQLRRAARYGGIEPSVRTPSGTPRWFDAYSTPAFGARLCG